MRNTKRESRQKMDQTSAPKTASSDHKLATTNLQRSEEARRRLLDTTSSYRAASLFDRLQEVSCEREKPQDESGTCHQNQEVAPAATTRQLFLDKTRLSRGHHHSSTVLNNLIYNFFNLLIINTVLSHLNQLNYIITTSTLNDADNNNNKFHLDTWKLSLPNIISAHALECNIDGDCASKDKICHENKCICARDRPIEDQGRCLPLALINGECTLPEQCLGNSQCVDGTCSCGNDAISLYNPSTKIFYCHPKRQLNQECNYDSQCPSNSYCSTSKYGCLCQNGFAPSNIQYNGKETIECLPKRCFHTSSCEEYHECTDNICKCLATHFDPTVAKCYKFGSTGGKPLEDSGNATAATNDQDNFYSILKDLTENGDKLWLVLTILIILSILILLLIIMLIRKYSLGYCWTAHKKEYEPNSKSQPKNGYFNKNSINNKSFRQKNGELEEEEENGDDLAEDRSNLVMSKDKTGEAAAKRNITAATTGEKNNYIKIKIHDKEKNKSSYQHELGSPLKTSTSTPV